MCCWGYGELSKESDGRARLRVRWWGRSWGWACHRAGREGRWIWSRKGAKSPETALQIPHSVKCLVLIIEGPAETRLFPASMPQGCGVGWQGRTRWLRGCVHLWEQMGCWPRTGLFSVWDRGGTSPSSMYRKMLWAIGFLPASSTAKLRKKRKRKEGCREMAQGEEVWRARLPFQNCCGEWIFQLWHLPLIVIELYMLMWIHPFLYFTPFCMGQHRRRVCPVCARRGGEHGAAVTCCLPHPSQPSLVCHFVMGNVRQLAAQASDCFLGFAFSFIYYSFFLLVLDVCKSSCFELWREHWVWNAWWWWHLGFFMLVFAWAILCMKVELMSQEERGGICEPSCIAAVGGPGSHQKPVLEGAPNLLCAQAPSHHRPGLPERCRMLGKNEAWIFLED